MRESKGARGIIVFDFTDSFVEENLSFVKWVADVCTQHVYIFCVYDEMELSVQLFLFIVCLSLSAVTCQRELLIFSSRLRFN